MLKSKAYCVSIAGLLFNKGQLVTTNQAGQTTSLSHKILAHLFTASWKTRVLMILFASLWRQFSNMNSVLYSSDTEETTPQRGKRQMSIFSRSLFLPVWKTICWQRIIQQNGFCQCVAGGGATHHREIDQPIFHAFKEGETILLPIFLTSVTKVQAPYFSPSRCNQHPQLVTGPDRCTTLLTEN